MTLSAPQESVNASPQLRSLLLFPPEAQPQRCNERMADGKFVVVYSGAAVQPQASQNDIHPHPTFHPIFPSPEATEVLTRFRKQHRAGVTL